MIPMRKLTKNGLEKFNNWLMTSEKNLPPQIFLDGIEETEIIDGLYIDENKIFDSRYQFGEYLNFILSDHDYKILTSSIFDGMWAWISVLYFSQLAKNGRSRDEHYIVQRSGPKGSLAYRNAARTSYDLFHIHGEYSLLCLSKPMNVFGDIQEQLLSRQAVSHNKGFFRAASKLYMHDGILKRGTSTRPKKKSTRLPGDKTGAGAIRRFATIINRLDLLFDTDEMGSTDIIAVLPREFSRWIQ